MTVSEIARKADISEDQAHRGIQWLLDKKRVRTTKKAQVILQAGPATIRAIKLGLPERRLLKALKAGQDVSEISDDLGSDYRAALGICAKNKWVRISGGVLTLVSYPDVIPGEDMLERLVNGIPDDAAASDTSANDTTHVSHLKRRPGYVIQKSIPATFSLDTDADTQSVKISARSTAGVGLKADFKTSKLDVEASDRIDVEAPAATLQMARTHPLAEVISEIREAFVRLGFEEVGGNLVQTSFWNFDALFTPQDHPAREMQDTFFVRGATLEQDSTAVQQGRVARMHQDMWRYTWNNHISCEAVMRTHTTCITIRHLAEHNPSEGRFFSMGPVFRNEKPSYKHLAEFRQIEGVVIGQDVSLRNLMGIQRQFYNIMGLKKIKFWPTFFPYTEPSLQSMVYSDELGKWVELFGMGIFRPEVTKPLGIERPVLAWGGGIERIAMLRYLLNDVRDFYANNMGWLRRVNICR